MQLAFLAALLCCLQGSAVAATYEGYASKTDEKTEFLAEVDKVFPCWHCVCEDTLRLRAGKFRRQYWFQQTFYSGRDNKQRKAIEAMAKTYGIVL